MEVPQLLVHLFLLSLPFTSCAPAGSLPELDPAIPPIDLALGDLALGRPSALRAQSPVPPPPLFQPPPPWPQRKIQEEGDGMEGPLALDPLALAEEQGRDPQDPSRRLPAQIPQYHNPIEGRDGSYFDAYAEAYNRYYELYLRWYNTYYSPYWYSALRGSQYSGGFPGYGRDYGVQWPYAGRADVPYARGYPAVGNGAASPYRPGLRNRLAYP